MQNKSSDTILVNELKYEVNNNSKQACFYIEKSEQTKNGQSKQQFLWHSQKWNLTLIDERKLNPATNRRSSYRNVPSTTKRTFVRRSKLPDDGDIFVVRLVKSKSNGGVLHDVVWSADRISEKEKYLHVTCFGSDINATKVLTDSPKVVYGPTQDEDLDKSYQSNFETSDSHGNVKRNGELAKICYTTEKLLRLQKNKELFVISPVNIKLSYDPVVIFTTEYEEILGFSTSRFQISERGRKTCDSQKLQVTTRGGHLADFSLSFSEMGKLKNLFRKKKEVEDIVYEYIPDDMIVIDCIDENPTKHKAVVADDVATEGYQEMNLNTTMQSVSIRLKPNLNSSYDSLDLPVLSRKRSRDSDRSQDKSFEISNTSTTFEFQKVFSDIEKLNSEIDSYGRELEDFRQSIGSEKQDKLSENVFDEQIEETKLFKRPKLPTNLRLSENCIDKHEVQNLVTVNVQNCEYSPPEQNVQRGFVENIIEDENTELYISGKSDEIDFESMERKLIEEEVEFEIKSIKSSINKKELSIEYISDETILQKQPINKKIINGHDQKLRAEIKMLTCVAIDYDVHNNDQSKSTPKKILGPQNRITDDIMTEFISDGSTLDIDFEILENEELKSFVKEINNNCQLVTIQTSDDIFEAISPPSEFLPLKRNSNDHTDKCFNEIRPLMLEDYAKNNNINVIYENSKLRGKITIVEDSVGVKIDGENFNEPDFECLLIDDFTEDLNIQKWEILQTNNKKPNVKSGALFEEVVLQRDASLRKINLKNKNDNVIAHVQPFTLENYIKNEKQNITVSGNVSRRKGVILDDDLCESINDEASFDFDFEILDVNEFKLFLSNIKTSCQPAIHVSDNLVQEITLSRDNLLKKYSSRNQNNDDPAENIKPFILNNYVKKENMNKNIPKQSFSDKELILDDTIIESTNSGARLDIDFEILDDVELKSFLNEIINSRDEENAVVTSFDEVLLPRNPSIVKKTQTKNKTVDSVKVFINQSFTLKKYKRVPSSELKTRSIMKTIVSENEINIAVSDDSFSKPDFENLVYDDFKEDLTIDKWETVCTAENDLPSREVIRADITENILEKNENCNRMSKKPITTKSELCNKQTIPFVLEPYNVNYTHQNNLKSKERKHKSHIEDEELTYSLNSSLSNEPDFEKLILDDIEVYCNTDTWEFVVHKSDNTSNACSKMLLKEEVMSKNVKSKRKRCKPADQGTAVVEIKPIAIVGVVQLSNTVSHTRIGVTQKNIIEEELVFGTLSKNSVDINLRELDSDDIDCEDGKTKNKEACHVTPPPVKKKSLKTKARNILSKKFKRKNKDTDEELLRKHSLDTESEMFKGNMKRSYSVDSLMYSDIDPNRQNGKTNIIYDQMRFNKSNEIVKSRLYTPEVVRKNFEYEVSLIKKERQRVPYSSRRSASVTLERKSYGTVTLKSTIPEKNKYTGSLSVGRLAIPESFAGSFITEEAMDE